MLRSVRSVKFKNILVFCVLKKKFYSTNSRRCCYSWLDLGVPQASFKANNCSASRAAMHSKLNSSIVWEQKGPEACLFFVSFPYTSSAPSVLKKKKTPVPRNSLSSPLQSYTYNKYLFALSRPYARFPDRGCPQFTLPKLW